VFQCYTQRNHTPRRKETEEEEEEEERHGVFTEPLSLREPARKNTTPTAVLERGCIHTVANQTFQISFMRDATPLHRQHAHPPASIPSLPLSKKR